MVGLGAHAITVTATDAAGNSASCTTSFTVTDNTPPTVSCPAATSASASGNCQAAVPNVVRGVTASDTCSSAGTITRTQAPAAGTMVGLGTHTITVTATDAAGNSATCSTIFTVTDNTPPTITTCAPNQSAFANGVCQAPVPDFTTNGLVATDCNGSAPLQITQSPAAGTLVGLGVTTVTLHVIDVANNESTCTATFTEIGRASCRERACASNQSAYADGVCQAPVPDFTTNGLVATDGNGSAPLQITQTP